MLLLPQFSAGRNESRYAQFTRPWEKIVGGGISIYGRVWAQGPKKRCIQLTYAYAMLSKVMMAYFGGQPLPDIGRDYSVIDLGYLL